jgi:hypothetical protein
VRSEAGKRRPQVHVKTGRGVPVQGKVQACPKAAKPEQPKPG